MNMSAVNLDLEFEYTRPWLYPLQSQAMFGPQDVSGALASAPFAALVETPPQGEAARKVADDGDYSQVAWFARRVAISNALGPASFVRFRKSRASRPADGISSIPLRKCPD